MSHTTTESDDIVFSKDQIESPFADDSCGGNSNGGTVLKKGPWTAAEDAILIDYVKKHGEGNWNAVQKHSGLSRCGKSCRLRWANHLRPNLKKGAFTPEEEQLIIELHAKMGNKWARMAGHLPGRTDNEIKNYWNTRIKRRQRAGLPLYPAEVSMQALQENQPSLSIGGIFAGDKGHHDLLQHNSYEIPDVIFDQFKANQGISPYVPELQGLGSSQYGSFISPPLHRQKRLRESAPTLPGYTVKQEFPLFEQFQDGLACSLSSQFEPTPSNGNQEHSFCENQGSHALENGNVSASKPSLGLVKLELPSLQYPDNDLGSWGTPPPPSLETVDSFIHSPNAGNVQPSPRNSGLLDALLYEARTRGKNHSSDKSSNSSTVTPGETAETSAMNMSATEWEEFGDPLSPLGHTGCTPISNGDNFTGCKVKSEPVDYSWSPERVEETSIQLDRTRPDVLFDWLGQGSGYIKETDIIATLLGSDLSSDYKQMSAGASSVNKGRGLGSCAWNAMPAVCQMSELP